MTNSEIICDTELVSRYLDNELDGNELKRVETHISDCKSCRTRLNDYIKIDNGINFLINNRADAQSRGFENRVIEAIRGKRAGSTSWKKAVLSKRMLVPAGLAVSVILMFFTFLKSPAQIGPTAIVSSLSGSGSSVMILETSETRQTILWFNENG